MNVMILGMTMYRKSSRKLLMHKLCIILYTKYQFPFKIVKTCIFIFFKLYSFSDSSIFKKLDTSYWQFNPDKSDRTLSASWVPQKPSAKVILVGSFKTQHGAYETSYSRNDLSISYLNLRYYSMNTIDSQNSETHE